MSLDLPLLLSTVVSVLTDPAFWLLALRITLVIYAIAAAHEVLHWAAARSLGVRGRFVLPRVLGIPVALAVDLPDDAFAALSPWGRLWVLNAPLLLVLAWPLAVSGGWSAELGLMVVGGSLLPYAVTPALASDGLRSLDALMDLVLGKRNRPALVVGASLLLMALWLVFALPSGYLVAFLGLTTLASARGLLARVPEDVGEVYGVGWCGCWCLGECGSGVPQVLQDDARPAGGLEDQGVGGLGDAEGYRYACCDVRQVELPGDPGIEDANDA